MEEETVLNKKDYLRIRNKLINGHIDEEIMNFFYNYWIKNKKEEYKNLEYEEFKPLFIQYLEYGINFSAAINNIFSIYDNELNVTYVKDKSGRLLTII